MSAQNILLMGSPGSGKGTQSLKLVNLKSLSHLSTGDLFRSHLNRKTDLGLLAKTYIDKGQLVPNQVTNDMVGQFVKELSQKKGIVFDGFPRNVSQAEALKMILTQNDRSLPKVIFLDISDEQVIKRLAGRLYAPKSGLVYHIKNKPPKKQGICDVSGEALITRPDDTEKVIQSRLDVFHQNTKPLLDYYKDRGFLQIIEANHSPEQVFDSILQALESF